MLVLLLCLCPFIPVTAQQQALPVADTLIYLENDSACTMYVGFYIDDDEVEFLYDLKTDSTCGITDSKLQLFDRWGTLKGEIKENHFTYAVGYSHDPYYGEKEFNYIFSYKDKAGVAKQSRGFVRDIWW